MIQYWYLYKSKEDLVLSNNKKESKFFRFFNYHRDNQVDALEEDTTPTLRRYFKVLGRRFWKLISLNIMMLPMILPILLIAYLYLGTDKTPTQNNVIFSQLYGANMIDSTPTSTFLLDLFGAQLEIPVYFDVWTYIGIGAAALFLIVTFGWQNVGATYVARSMVRGEPVFTFSDYFYAIRRNLGQGFVMGLVDLGVIFLLVSDFLYFSSLPSSFWIDVCYFTVTALAVIYFFMRFYLYLLLITFELKIRKIIKNAFIFVMLGIKRNLMSTLGIILITAFNIALFPLFAMTPLGIAIPVILPFLYYLAFTVFTTAYAAYPVIDRYMIEPYRNANIEESESTDTEE